MFLTDVTLFLAGEELEQLSAGDTSSRPHNGSAYLASDEKWVAVGGAGVARADSAGESGLANQIATLSADDAVSMLRSKGIGAAIVLAGSEMYLANAARGNDVFVRSPNGDLVKGFPFQLQRSPMNIHRDSPAVGEHSSQVLTQ